MKKSIILILVALLAMPTVLSARTKLAILNDTHVSPGNHTQEGLKAAIKELPSTNVDAVIFNGDLTNEGSNAELQNFKEIIEEITLPLYVNPGNHENNWSQSAGQTYVKLFGMDRFKGVVGPDSIIIIGTNCGPYMRMGDGHVKQEDLLWLQTSLDSLTAKYPDSRILSFNHYALNPDMDNYLDYINTLKPYPVLAHVNGHYHIYNLEKIEGETDMKDITLSCLDRKNGKFGYSILDITPDSIFVYSKIVGEPEELKYSFKVPEKVKFKKVPESWKVNEVYADKASIFTRPAVSGNTMIYGTSDGNIRALNLSDGSVKWNVEVGAPIYSMPLIVGDKVYVPTTNKGILELNGNTGKVIASIPDTLPIVADGIIGPDGKNVYLGGYGKMVAFNTQNNKKEWTFEEISNYCQGQPALKDDNLVFGAWDSYLRNVNPKTGEMKWKWNNGKKSNMLGPGNVVPIITGNRVVIVAPDRYMTMIDLNTGETVWRDNSYRYRESLGVSNDGTKAYAKTMDGLLVAIDITKDEFTPAWVTDMFIGYEHAPCPIIEVDGYIYAGSRRGIVSVLDADNGELVATVNLGVSEVNGFAPVEGFEVEEGLATPVAVSLIEGKVATITPKKK